MSRNGESKKVKKGLYQKKIEWVHGRASVLSYYTRSEAKGEEQVLSHKETFE